MAYVAHRAEKRRADNKDNAQCIYIYIYTHTYTCLIYIYIYIYIGRRAHRRAAGPEGARAARRRGSPAQLSALISPEGAKDAPRNGGRRKQLV